MGNEPVKNTRGNINARAPNWVAKIYNYSCTNILFSIKPYIPGTGGRLRPLVRHQICKSIAGRFEAAFLMNNSLGIVSTTVTTRALPAFCALQDVVIACVALRARDNVLFNRFLCHK